MTINFSAMSGRLSQPLRWLVDAVPAHWTMRVIQGPLRGAQWIAGSGNAGCWLGTYELELQEMFVRLVEPGSVVFDVGANVGFFSLLASRLAGPRGRVYAFEPHPGNAVLLRRHVALNHASNITVIEAAVSDRSGEISLDGDGSTAHVGSKGLPVRAVTLDDLWGSGSIERPDVIKMDVEGAELPALLGMRRLLEPTQPDLLIEFHGALVNGHDMDTESRLLLAELGYTLSTLRCGETHARRTAASRLCKPK